MSSSLKLGIVGACGRGASFKAACDALPNVEVRAVCDTNAADLPAAAERLGAREQYTDYDTMLERAALDAVIIGTPMPLHVPQAIAALRRGVHVLSEVPAGVSMAECRDLVRATHESAGIYRMAENYLYTRQNVLIRELVRQGLFGTPYYAEGEYLHELKELNEVTRWRRKWQTGINGNTYPTHSLGPILQWMPGDRVVSVCCAGSGQHHRDAAGVLYENEATTVMLCRMKSGGLVKIRLDMLSDRPHAMTNYQLQGTDGCYESARAHGETDRIWLRSTAADRDTWQPLSAMEAYVPDWWRQASAAAQNAGHGGGDYFAVSEFVDAVRGNTSAGVDIHAAMDMTLPGLVSQDSITQNGLWREVPDSRTWLTEDAEQPQLRMIFPLERHDTLSETTLPDGYLLRNLREGDESAYIALMDQAGFGGRTVESVQAQARRVLPGGFFVIEHRATGRLVATAMANHSPHALHPNGGSLDWVAADAAHSGKGLGRAVVTSVVRLLVQRGYRHIYLQTDDWRLPAIAVYLQLGWEPLLYTDGMAERWTQVRTKLGARKR
jgi:predicted dehydrogenase/GNAT superfamily N-acetyltransferase